MAKEKVKDTTDLFDYNEESIKSLDWKEHIRMRPGMYIGKLVTVPLRTTVFISF